MAMATKLLCTAFVMMCALMLTSPRFCDGRERLSAAAVVHGTVFCDTCSDNTLSDATYFISGASVAVECDVNRKTARSIRVEGESDEEGHFRIDVPIYNVRKCRVELLKAAEGSWCNVPSISTSPDLTLTSASDGGVRAYAAGYLSYRPENIPTPCLMDDSRSELRAGREALEKDTDATSKATVPPPFLPTIPALPNPPPIPTIPGLPNPPPFPTIPALPNPPPFPSIPALPTFPPFPAIPNAPPLSVPPLPNFNFPPIPFFTPPPPSK